METFFGKAANYPLGEKPKRDIFSGLISPWTFIANILYLKWKYHRVLQKKPSAQSQLS